MWCRLSKGARARGKSATPVRAVITERVGVRPLVVEGASDRKTADWTKLSRRHAIDVNAQGGHVSIFGGKLTDCINVGEEICAHVRAISIGIATGDFESVYGEFESDARLTERESNVVVALTLGSVVFFVAERRGAKTRSDRTLTMTEAVWIGCAQAVALIPGVSRSGITIAVALLLGLRRPDAARFIFLLAIPAILGAAGSEAPASRLATTMGKYTMSFTALSSAS